jgi:beta-N-acetylhexosaminidase
MKSGAQPIAKTGGFRFYSLIGAALMLFAALPLMGQTALEKGEKLFWQTAEPVYVPDHLRLSWADAQAAAIVTRMNDEELLSQILMLGYPGKDVPPELLSWIAKRGLGGIKVFGRNAEDSRALASAVSKFQKTSLQQELSIPLLVATDQEGGWIRHVKGRSSESPGNMAIGATASSRDAYLSGFYLGRELRALGITMNFAPVLDLATAPESSIIGPRAFSDDPVLAARLGIAWARGSIAAGVIPTVKHFPGHGATVLDSHGILPRIDIDQSTFLRRELYPFEQAVKAGLPAVMSGHLAFTQISGSEPASLSRQMIGGFLRERLGFDGLVITDDLYMEGALDGDGILETCLKAIRAGNDLLLLSSAPTEDGKLWKGLLAALKEDQSLRTAIELSVRRILALKSAYLREGGRDSLIPDPEAAVNALPDADAQVFFADLARRSVSVIGRGAELPFAPRGSVLIAAPFGEFLSLGRERYPDSRGFSFSFRPERRAKPEELEAFKKALSGCAGAIVCVANRAGIQFATLAHEQGVQVAIISVLSPIHAAHSPWSKAALAVYHYAPVCLEAGLDVLAGRLKPQGRVPLADHLIR